MRDPLKDLSEEEFRHFWEMRTDVLIKRAVACAEREARRQAQREESNWRANSTKAAQGDAA